MKNFSYVTFTCFFFPLFSLTFSFLKGLGRQYIMRLTGEFRFSTATLWPFFIWSRYVLIFLTGPMRAVAVLLMVGLVWLLVNNFFGGESVHVLSFLGGKPDLSLIMSWLSEPENIYYCRCFFIIMHVFMFLSIELMHLLF